MNVVDAAQKAWIQTLAPEVREQVAAEIDFYDSEELWEFEEANADDGWKPPENGGMGLTVDFSGEEIKTLTTAFGASVEMFEIMHDALMERAREALKQREDSDAVAAAD